LSATILPFIRRATATLNVTQAERVEAAAWAAHLACAWGGLWWIETHCGDDGRVWVEVVTPSSLAVSSGDPAPAWMIARAADGVTLTDLVQRQKAGTFLTVARALAAIERTEKRPRAIAYP
jgi:hypothetical protein